MPPFLNYICTVLGVSFLLYVIGRFLENLSLRHYDSYKDTSGDILNTISESFYIAGFCVTIPIFLLHRFPDERTRRGAIEEGRCIERRKNDEAKDRRYAPVTFSDGVAECNRFAELVVQLRLSDWRTASRYWVKHYTGSTDDFDPSARPPAEYSHVDDGILDNIFQLF